MKKTIKIEPVLRYVGLCHRCEERARFIETGFGARFECGQVSTKSATASCYMYRPVRPLELLRNKGEKRPQLAGYMFSARSHSFGVPKQLELKAEKTKQGVLLYWTPASKEFLKRLTKYNQVIKRKK